MPARQMRGWWWGDHGEGCRVTGGGKDCARLGAPWGEGCVHLDDLLTLPDAAGWWSGGSAISNWNLRRLFSHENTELAAPLHGCRRCDGEQSWLGHLIGAWVPFSSQLPRVIFQGVSLTRAFQVLTGSLFYLSLRSNAPGTRVISNTFFWQTLKKFEALGSGKETMAWNRYSELMVYKYHLLQAVGPSFHRYTHFSASTCELSCTAQNTCMFSKEFYCRDLISQKKRPTHCRVI
jgi:hypothetical protein